MTITIPYPTGCDAHRPVGFPLPDDGHREGRIRLARFRQQVAGFRWVRSVEPARRFEGAVVDVDENAPGDSLAVLTRLYQALLPANARTRNEYDWATGRWSRVYVERDVAGLQGERRLLRAGGFK